MNEAVQDRGHNREIERTHACIGEEVREETPIPTIAEYEVEEGQNHDRREADGHHDDAGQRQLAEQLARTELTVVQRFPLLPVHPALAGLEDAKDVEDAAEDHERDGHDVEDFFGDGHRLLLCRLFYSNFKGSI